MSRSLIMMTLAIILLSPQRAIATPPSGVLETTQLSRPETGPKAPSSSSSDSPQALTDSWVSFHTKTPLSKPTSAHLDFQEIPLDLKKDPRFKVVDQDYDEAAGIITELYRHSSGQYYLVVTEVIKTPEKITDEKYATRLYSVKNSKELKDKKAILENVKTGEVLRTQNVTNGIDPKSGNPDFKAEVTTYRDGKIETTTHRHRPTWRELDTEEIVQMDYWYQKGVLIREYKTVTHQYGPYGKDRVTTLNIGKYLNGKLIYGFTQKASGLQPFSTEFFLHDGDKTINIKFEHKKAEEIDITPKRVFIQYYVKNKEIVKKRRILKPKDDYPVEWIWILMREFKN